MMSWSIAQEKYNDKLYFRKNPVYKLENLLLIKWILIESGDFYLETDLTHYCIVTEQDVVDIISMCEPTYRIISIEIQQAIFAAGIMVLTADGLNYRFIKEE